METQEITYTNLQGGETKLSICGNSIKIGISTLDLAYLDDLFDIDTPEAFANAIEGLVFGCSQIISEATLEGINISGMVPASMDFHIAKHMVKALRKIEFKEPKYGPESCTMDEQIKSLTNQVEYLKDVNKTYGEFIDRHLPGAPNQTHLKVVHQAK